MLTPDEVRVRFEQVRESGDPWRAMALLEEVLPELVALAEDGRRYREQQACNEAALAALTERVAKGGKGTYVGNGVWIA